MNAGKVLLGVLAGLTAGALLGVLFAPEKGTDTRRKISEKEGDLADLLKDKFKEFLGHCSEKCEKVKEDVSDFAERVQTKSKEEKY